MKVKRYTAPTMQEAIDQVRHDLGPSAVILHSRKVGRGGLLNVLSKPAVEVTAALAEEARGPHPPQTMPPADRELDETEQPTDHRLAAYFRPPPTEAAAERGGSVVEDIRRELVAYDVDALLAEALLRSAVEDLRTTDNAGLIREYIEKRVERFIRVTGPIRLEPGTPSIVALAGPTGVGKTTTAAKLAAHFACVERENVAIIAADVFRVAGIEQMRAYAKLLNIPIDVVLTPTDMRSTIAGHSDKDLILIDSGGSSPYDWMHVLELTSFLKEAKNAQVHLVLSAATRCKENLAVIERFSSMGIHGIVFTKLDETRDYGSLLTLAIKSKQPIAYLTAGQNIPDDIEHASPGKLARMILHTQAEGKAAQPTLSAAQE